MPSVAAKMATALPRKEAQQIMKYTAFDLSVLTTSSDSSLIDCLLEIVLRSGSLSVKERTKQTMMTKTPAPMKMFAMSVCLEISTRAVDPKITERVAEPLR